MKGSSLTTFAGLPVAVKISGHRCAMRRLELNGVISESLVKVPQKPARSISHKSMKAKDSGA
jgi:hypothetical protein